MEFKQDKGITYPNLWDRMIAVLRGKLIALSASKKMLERAYTSSLIAHLRALEENGDNTHKSRTQIHQTKEWN